ncbi:MULTISPECIES: hypothetical protein [unclassified Arthrobacter]|uniref:hypothetical protein n=1 Tax=unclassified Arthrobacter TaxID=235627 RepID=UPI002102DD89|nr:MULTISPECIES: hypothetical protein [unclassified Arthrobacter]MCQ1946065.1 hypothetical protein [Arthrobacter sp. zg-Y1116]MCQ1986003.1 hypothetical protein [Arthrobacter sp. zg-Y844]
MDDYVTTGTFWFMVALINAGLAEQKNRSRWIWFLLSLLLGPIATILIVVRRAPEPVEPSMTHRGGWKNPDPHPRSLGEPM